MQISLDQSLFTLPCEDFFFTVVSNPQLLKQGYEIVYKYLSISQQNREQTLLHLLSKKAPVLTLVSRTYPVVYADQTLKISDEQKTKTKEYLILEVLLKKIILPFGKQSQANQKNLSSLIEFLLHFHNIEGFESWVGFYQKLLQSMIQSSSSLISQILKQILKSSDDRVSSFSKYILPFIISSQSLAHISEEDSLQIIYYCVKSMGYMNGTEDEVLQQYYEPYQARILEYIQGAINKSQKIMKFSLKILTVLVGEYEVELEKEMVNKLKEIVRVLVGEFIKQRVKNLSSEHLEDEEDDEEENTSSLSIIIYQLIELFQTLLSCQQIKLTEYQTFFALCLPSLLLTKADYLSYSTSTETYLADIEDQGQKNLRNKVLSFLLELYQGDYPPKTKAKMHAHLLKYIMLIQLRSIIEDKFGEEVLKYFAGTSLELKLEKYHLLLIEQSLTFLLYHLTEEILTTDNKDLQQTKNSLMMTLGKNLQLSTLSTQNRVIKVSYINLLNKLIKSMGKSVKEEFYLFLLESVQKINDFEQEKGFVLSICRGIAYIAGEVQIGVQSSQTQKGIPVKMLQNIINYLMNQQTLQQSAHLILQFLVTLIKKCPSSLNPLLMLITSQIQIHILSTFIHDGTIADVVIELLGEIGSEQFAQFTYSEVMKGFAKEENLMLLIARWVQNGRLRLTEVDVRGLLTLYKGQFAAQVIKEFLVSVEKQKTSNNLTEEFISFLNGNIQPSWILPLIRNNILLNPQQLLLSTINTITYELTSQYELQKQLLLPYYTVMSNSLGTLTLIKSKSVKLYVDFMTKLIRYAGLFQGPNLKVITCHVLLNVCEVDQSQIGAVFELIKLYGKSGMQADEWEDEEEKNEDVVDRMFNNMRMVNDEVQKDFAQIFGNLVYDMAGVNFKVDRLTQLIPK